MCPRATHSTYALCSYVARVHYVSSCYAHRSSVTSRHGATYARVLVSELPDTLRLVIKLVKDVCGLGLKDAKDLARLAPRPSRKYTLLKMQRSSQLTSRQLVLKLKLSNFISTKIKNGHLLTVLLFSLPISTCSKYFTYFVLFD